MTRTITDAAVSRGLAQSAAGETVDLGDFTQYLIPDAAEPGSVILVTECRGDLVCACATNLDGSKTATLCPLHGETDPCFVMAQVTGRRRKGSIIQGTCSNCGWEATR